MTTAHDSPDTTETPVVDPDAETQRARSAGFRLQYAAISDVGRYRKDNQDSGYAGPWALILCDGVGGAVRGDIASATAVQQLRKLDADPGDNLLSQVAGALHRAHDRIAEIVDEDPSLESTSTTATVALFDGHRFAIGHLGDSRAYLYRDGLVTQLTTDHTFVQSLIDEGRISEEEARTHPHRNLILKALDGVHDTEPDLFHVDVSADDRLLLCSDGASDVLTNQMMADILGSGTPDFAAVELVRRALEEGTTDNVTCIVGEVVPSDTLLPGDLEPMLVGAAAELPRRPFRAAGARTLFRGHRSGDTGELDPVAAPMPELPPDVHAITADPLDPEAARYAPRPPQRHAWLRTLLIGCVLAGLLWAGLAAGWSWTQRQFYVGQSGGMVTIFRGLNAELMGFELSQPYETTDLDVSRLATTQAETVQVGIDATSLADARRTVENLAARQLPQDVGTTP